MRRFAFTLFALTLAACANPVTEQAAKDGRQDPVRADSMLAIEFQGGGAGQLGVAQFNELKTMVAVGRRARRDEFVVVTDGSGGPAQQARAETVRRSLARAGAQWTGTAVEPTMTMGPNSVVIVRSEYRLGSYNCPNHSGYGTWNPNEAVTPGFGCADAYNRGQMLARPRDAAIGRDTGPGDGTVLAAAVQRYHEGRVRALVIPGTGSGSQAGGADRSQAPTSN